MTTAAANPTQSAALAEAARTNNVQITTVNTEQFKDSVFVLLTLRALSFRAKVKDPLALGGYLDKLQEEIKAKQAAGEEVNASQVQVTTATGGIPKNAKSATNTTKTLLFSPALDALRAHLSNTKARICGPAHKGGLANQSSIMDGLFEVKIATIPKVNAIIAEAKLRLMDPFQVTEDGETVVKPGYLKAFLDDYEAAITRAETAPLLEGGLGPLFNRADYPSRAQVERGFDIERRYIALGVPEGLPPELRDQAAEELRATFRDAAEEIKQGMRAGFAKLLEHARDTLTTKPGDKPKVFRDTLIGNVLQFCDTFDARNTQGDQELSALVAQAKEMVSGMDPQKLRKFASTRAEAAEKFGEMANAMAGMITTQKGRVMDFSEE